MAPLRPAVLGPGLVLRASSGPAGFLMGLLCDLFGDLAALKGKSNVEVSNDTFGHSFYFCEAREASIWANLRASYLVASGGRGRREGA